MAQKEKPKGTKSQRKVKSGNKPIIKVDLPLLISLSRKPIVQIVGNKFAEVDIDKLSVEHMKSVLTQAKSQVKKELENKQEKVAIGFEVMSYLSSPAFDREENGDLIRRGEKKAITMVIRDIHDRRRINRIKNLLEEAWTTLENELSGEEDLEENPVELRAIKLTLVADDAKFLAEGMIQYYEKDYTGTSFHIVEAHDLFIELKNRATELMDDYNSGKEKTD